MNILSLIQSQFSQQTVGQISKLVGENESGTKSALGSAVPAVLGSLVGKASSPGGAGEVMNLLNQGQSSGSLSDSASGLLSKITGGGGLSQMMDSTGTSQLNSVLGSKTGGVTDYISRASGIRSGSAMSLLGMAATLVMGVIHKHVASNNLDVGGLGKLLGSQTQYLKGAMPAGLADTLGIGNLLKAPDVPSGESMAAKGRELAETGRAKSRGLSKMAWLIIGLIAIGGLMYFTRVHRGQRIVEPSGSQAPSAQGVSDTVKLPTGQQLHLTSGSAADQLAKAALRGDVNQSFDLKGLNFDSAGSLSSSSKGSVQELGSVLTAFPNLNVRISSGGATQEEGLSRAQAIKSQLVSAGISSDRIKTSGEAGNATPKLSVER